MNRQRGHRASKRMIEILGWVMMTWLGGGGCSESVQAETFYVSTEGGEIEDGSQTYPYTDLQQAVDGAATGDTIIVYPGDHTFSEDTLEIDKDLVIQNLDPNLILIAEMTRLCGTIRFDASITEACVLNSFTFMELTRGALWGNHSTPTIQNCIFQGNGPCNALIKECDGVFQNCLIADNAQLQDCGSPAAIVDDCTAMFVNCTIVNNRNGMQLNGGFIENCIITGNGSNGADQLLNTFSSGDLMVQYSDVEGWSDLEAEGVIILGSDGTDMLDVDPNFVQEGSWDTNDPTVFTPGDYHLKCKGWRWMKLGMWTQDDRTSYCVDAGNSESSLGNEVYSGDRSEDSDFYNTDDIGNSGWNPSVNLGFYGGTYEASVLQDGETPWSSNGGSSNSQEGAELSPNPPEWESSPQETLTKVGGWNYVYSCTMTAAEVTSSTDNTVYYMFDCKTADATGWATRRTYEFSIDTRGEAVGLQFRVKAKDSVTGDETEWSDWATVVPES